MGRDGTRTGVARHQAGGGVAPGQRSVAAPLDQRGSPRLLPRRWQAGAPLLTRRPDGVPGVAPLRGRSGRSRAPTPRPGERPSLQPVCERPRAHAPGRRLPRRRDPGREEAGGLRSEEHTSELQSLAYLVCRLLLEKKKTLTTDTTRHGRTLTVASARYKT